MNTTEKLLSNLEKQYRDFRKGERFSVPSTRYSKHKNQPATKIKVKPTSKSKVLHSLKKISVKTSKFGERLELTSGTLELKVTENKAILTIQLDEDDLNYYEKEGRGQESDSIKELYTKLAEFPSVHLPELLNKGFKKCVKRENSNE